MRMAWFKFLALLAAAPAPALSLEGTAEGAAEARPTAVQDEGIFTSNADLQELLWTEAELVRGMREYIAEEEERLDRLRR